MNLQGIKNGLFVIPYYRIYYTLNIVLIKEFIFLARRLLPLRWEMNDGSPNLRKQLIANKWYICYN